MSVSMISKNFKSHRYLIWVVIFFLRKDLVERDTAETGKDFSRQQDNKPPHCQWHATVRHWVGPNQGVHILFMQCWLLHSFISFKPIKIFTLTQQPQKSTGLDPLVAEELRHRVLSSIEQCSKHGSGQFIYHNVRSQSKAYIAKRIRTVIVS